YTSSNKAFSSSSIGAPLSPCTQQAPLQAAKSHTNFLLKTSRLTMLLPISIILSELYYLCAKLLKMPRILTGIQATGTPHLGNLLGAIQPRMQHSQRGENGSVAFIADLHPRTAVEGSDLRAYDRRAVAASWLA